MQVRCPQCEDTVAVSADSSLANINCSTCGSDFSLYSGTEAESLDAPNSAIGHFALQEKLGAGAFGVVWKARDTKLERIVALKIPRMDRLDAAGETQFLREAQAAAQLRHPNIVSIHEVGRQDDTIYIVNDFIQGVTLADYLAGFRPDFRQTAELCAAIADGLQHAHDAGVVHRDLKPANIMLDQNNQPYIMDFGLARRDVTDVTISVDGKIMGTPAYMSPEQSSGHGNTADGRTDVYSLGGILFELLTGERPFRGSFRMLMHQVINDDPPQPRKLNSNVPRDLETICLKCLRKSPDARYVSAAELAADIRRWLNREPIHARPVSGIERLVRWCQRKPAVASLAALAAVLAVAGFSGVTWQWLKADRLRIQAEANLQQSELQRDRRDANFETALQAVDTMLTHVADESLAKVPRMQRVRRDILEDAVSFYEGFLVEKGDDPDLLAETARAYTRMGDLRISLDEMDKAEVAFDHAIMLLDELTQQHPERIAYRTGLSDALASRARMNFTNRDIKEAIADGQRSIDIQQAVVDAASGDEENQILLAKRFVQLGVFLGETSDVEQAETTLKSALTTLEKVDESLEAAREQKAQTLVNLANIGRKIRGNTEDVEETIRASILLLEALCQEFPDERNYQVTKIKSELALTYLLINTNRADDVDAQFGRHVAAWENLVDDYPHIPEYLNELATTITDWAIMYARRGNLPRAIELMNQGTEILERLVADSPIPDYRKTLGGTYNNLGSMLANTGRFEESEQMMIRALAIREELLKEFPDIPAYQYDVNISCTNLANGIWMVESEKDGEPAPLRLEEAESLLQRAIEIGEELLKQPSAGPSYRHKLALTYRIHGQVWKDIDPDKAESSFRESLALMRELAIDAPRDFRTKRQLSYSLDQLADVLLSLKKNEESEAASIEAHEVVAELAEQGNQYAFSKDYAINARKLAERYVQMKKFPDASDFYRKSLELWSKLADEFPDTPDSHQQLSITRNEMAMFLATCPNLALRDPELAVELASLAVESDSEDEYFESTLGIARYRSGDWQQAVESMAKSREMGLEVEPLDDLYYAMALWQVGRNQESVDLYESVVTLASANDPEANERDEPLIALLKETQHLLELDQE